MAIPTIQQMNNADLDMRHLANIANSPAPTATNRVGAVQKTISGFVSQMNTIIQGTGFKAPVPYSAGITITDETTTVSYDGSVYAAQPSKLPFTTGPTFDPTKFRLIQGVAGAVLAAVDGSTLIGHGPFNLGIILENYFNLMVGSVAELKTISKDYFSQAMTRGYWADGDHGHGVYWLDHSDTTSPDNGGTVLVANDGGRWKLLFDGPVSVQKFGAKCAGNSDDTPRSQAAIDWGRATGNEVSFPAGGTAWITMLHIEKSLYNFGVRNYGCYIELIATEPTDTALLISGCVDLLITGEWRFNGANKSNYSSTIQCEVHPIIEEGQDAGHPTTRIKFGHITFRNCGVGFANGRYGVDGQCSEITFESMHVFQTPIPVKNSGADSGFSILGGHITSEYNPAFPDLVACVLDQEGGFVEICGGSLVTNANAKAVVISKPTPSGRYGNIFGTFTATGAHTEWNSPLVSIENPNNLVNAKSDDSSVRFIGDTGYAGGDVSKVGVYCSDPNYAGLFEAQSCGWYSSIARTGWNISSLSNKFRVKIDKTSFGRNFKNWLGGIFGAKVIGDDMPILSTYGLSNTFVTGSAQLVKFLIKRTTNELAHFQEWWNPTTGRFEVKPGGFTKLKFEATITGTGAKVGDFYLTRNDGKGGASVAIAYGVFNGVGRLEATVFDVEAGEYFELWFRPYDASLVTDAGIYNNLTITGWTN